MKTIGILAGMGPRSTAPFVDLIVSQCQIQYGARHDIDFPHMLIYSLPAPFYLDRPVDHQKLKQTVCEGLQRLERMGVDFIAVPCNTVHAYFDALKTCVTCPLLNIVEETLCRLPSGSRGIAIFATEATLNSGVYQKGISDAGKQVIHSDAIQTKVNRLLSVIKSEDPTKAIPLWHELLSQAHALGAEAAVIACTDLSMMPSAHAPLSLIDSSLSLAAAVVRTYLNESPSE